MIELIGTLVGVVVEEVVGGMGVVTFLRLDIAPGVAVDLKVVTLLGKVRGLQVMTALKSLANLLVLVLHLGLEPPQEVQARLNGETPLLTTTLGGGAVMEIDTLLRWMRR